MFFPWRLMMHPPTSSTSTLGSGSCRQIPYTYYYNHFMMADGKGFRTFAARYERKQTYESVFYLVGL